MERYWNWVLATLCVNVLVSVAQKGCPNQKAILPCRCLMRGEEYQIWCTHSDLATILDGLRAVAQLVHDPIDELILENNYLPSFPGRTFFPLKILRLMLRYNGLQRVSSDWLAGVETTLMELFLVEPDLRSLPDDSLMRTIALQAITIQTGAMKRLPLFSGLPKLRYLQIESDSLLELSPRNFKNNPSLEKVHISSSSHLDRLEANLFRDLPSLSLINISFCGINWIHPRAMTNLPVLTEVSLVGNKIDDARMIGRAGRDLPLLEIIRLDYNYISELSEASFVDLPALKKLHLSNNRITDLQHGAFHRVPSLRSIDLNKNMLRRVHPESFLQQSGSGLEELWLMENDVSHVADLHALLEALPRLIFLDMSYNNLEAIPFGSLRGHPTLEYLNLDYNKIHMIDREAFMAMPALRELRLKNNSLSDLLETPFWNLPELKGLDLSGNLFRRISHSLLADLPSLRKLDLHGNLISLIDPEAFMVTPALEYINISHNHLSALHPATFRPLLSLYELDVSFNRLVEFVPGLPSGIEYMHADHNGISSIPLLPSPDLDLPSLKLLDLSFNKIQKISNGNFRTLPQLRRLYLTNNLLIRLDDGSLGGLTRLETLALQNNVVTQLHATTFKENQDLRDLNLRNNRLEILMPDVFNYTPRLKKIDISRNLIAEILPGTFDKNIDIQMLDASHNLLTQLSPTFYALKNLRSLDLTSNRLKHISPEILSSLISLKDLKLSRNYIQDLKQGAFSSLQHLKSLSIDHNELQSIEPNAIKSLPVLKILDLSKNKLKELPNNAFTSLPALQTAQLQENQLKSIEPNAFSHVPHLLMLNLSYNMLENLEESGLQSLKSLELLDLSHNMLRSISGPSLEQMEWLVELRIDDNKICGVQGSPFNSMPRLRVLTLRNNKMMSFPEHAVQRIRGNIAVLNIDGNPLACACNVLWLRAWLLETAQMGPRCADGGLLREKPLSVEECPDDERNVELVAPGCEAELLSAPGVYGTSQVSTQWMSLKFINKSKEIKHHKQNGLAPSPEESEYFYDEYVDYPYNESVVEQNVINGGVKFAESMTVRVPVATKSPHYTPGDTPTLYAAPRNKTGHTPPKTVADSPSSSGFSFFGLPLPAIDLGKLIGVATAGRRPPPASPAPAERKMAIVNEPAKAATAQRHAVGGPAAVAPPPVGVAPGALGGIMPVGGAMPPSVPNVEKGGFVPLVPGSGGFRPIVNPMMQRPPPNITSDSSKIHLNRIAPLDKTATIKTQNVSSTTVSSPEMYTTSLPEKYSSSRPNLIIKSTTVGPLMVPSPISVSSKTVNMKDKQESIDIIPLRLENTTSTTQTSIVTTLNDAATEAVNEITTIISEAKLKTTENFNKMETTTPSTKVIDIPVSTPRTLLISTTSITRKLEEVKGKTTFLIPQGQEPLQFKQATITKLPSPHLSNSAPLQSSINFGHVPQHSVNNREPKNSQEYVHIVTSSTTEEVLMNDDTNWYFANYNKTDPIIAQEEVGLKSFGIVGKVNMALVCSAAVILVLI